MRFAAVAVLGCLCAGAAGRANAADQRWIRARLGPFETISDDGRKSATQALNQFAQFSFALGTAVGRPDLKLDPPLRIVVFRNAQELAAQCGSQANKLTMGRDRLMACATAEGQLPAPLLRDLTRTLLEKNFSRIPPKIEEAIETFFSTIQSNAVHVTWGAPPPASERTRQWALLHEIITQPEYAGKAQIYLNNIASGMDEAGAIRNAFGQEPDKFNAEADRYLTAGHFAAVQAPNRPINPDRDLSTTALTTDEGALMHADLLTPGSAEIYLSLLKRDKQTAPASEGLAILAMRAGDRTKVRQYMSAARKAGTKNFVALTDYAEMEDDVVDGMDAAKEALGIDPNYAKAHWVLGEKITEPRRRAPEWKIAVGLAPSNYEWAAEYATLCIELKQYAEAGRAYMAAAQAAPTQELRDRYLAARATIDSQRVADEEAERRKAEEEKARELAKLKTQAQQRVAELEARANSKPLTDAEKANTVDWYDSSADATLDGTLVRVDCAGKALRLEVKDDAGKVRTLPVSDPKQFLILNGEKTLSCGAQQPRRVTVALKSAKATGKNASSPAEEATGLEFH